MTKDELIKKYEEKKPTPQGYAEYTLEIDGKSVTSDDRDFRVLAKVASGIRVLDIREIYWIDTEGDFSVCMRINTVDGEPYNESATLQIDDLLYLDK